MLCLTCRRLFLWEPAAPWREQQLAAAIRLATSRLLLPLLRQGSQTSSSSSRSKLRAWSLSRPNKCSLLGRRLAGGRCNCWRHYAIFARQSPNSASARRPSAAGFWPRCRPRRRRRRRRPRRPRQRAAAAEQEAEEPAQTIQLNHSGGITLGQRWRQRGARSPTRTGARMS